MRFQHNRLKKYFFSAVIALLLCLLAHEAWAQNLPKRIRFIGLLTDRSDEFEVGSFDIQFNMYEAPTGGTPVFTETHRIVFIKKDRGIFTVDIGSITPLTLTFNRPYWMGVSIFDAGGYSAGEMIPRLEIGSSAYALNADRLDDIDSLSLLRSDADDDFEANSTLTIMQNLSIGGTLTETVVGNISELGIANDYFVIDNDNTAPDVIALIFGSLNREELRFSLLYDQFLLSDDLSITGDLTVQGISYLDGGFTVNDLFTVSSAGDTEVGNDLTVIGNTIFGNGVTLGTDASDPITLIASMDSNLTFSSGLAMRSLGGNMTLDPNGNIVLGGQSTDDTVLVGDLTLSTNQIFSNTAAAIQIEGEETTLPGNASLAGDHGLNLALTSATLNFANGAVIRNDLDDHIEINADLSIQENLDIYGARGFYLPEKTFIVGPDNPSDFANDSMDAAFQGDLEVKGDLSTPANLTINSIASFGSGIFVPEDLTVTGVTFTDQINTASGFATLTFDPPVEFIHDTTSSGANSIFQQTFAMINPVQGGAGVQQIGNNADSDFLLFNSDVTMLNSLSVAGSIYLNLAGVTSDTFTLDSDESSNTPRFAFEDADGDQYLEFNRTNRVFTLSYDATLDNALTVDKTLFTTGSGPNIFQDALIYIGSGNPSIATDNGDLFVQGDVELGGDLSVEHDFSIAGIIFGLYGTTVLVDLTVEGTLFVDTIRDETGTLTFGNGAQTVTLDSTDWDLDAQGNLDGIGSLTADGRLDVSAEGLNFINPGSSEIGADSGDSHLIRGTALFGLTDTLTISDTGSLTALADISLGNDVTDTFQITSAGINVATDGAISDTDSDVLIDDTELYVFGNLSAGGDLTIFGASPTRLVNGYLGIGSDAPSPIFDLTQSLLISGDLEALADLSVGGDLTLGAGLHGINGGLTFNDDFTIRGTLFIDPITTEADPYLTVYSGISLGTDLTLNLGTIFSPGNMLLDPNPHGAGVVVLGGVGDDDFIQVDGNLTVAIDVTTNGVMYGITYELGTLSSSFTIDLRESTNTPTLYFFDSSGNEFLTWNKPLQMLELSDDLSIDGGVTLYGDLLVEGGPAAASVFDGADTSVQITDGHLLLLDPTQPKGPSADYQDDGDFFVAGNFEILGSLSIGQDITVAGIITGDDHTQIINPLTVTGDLDVRGRVFDGLTDVLDLAGTASISESLTLFGTEGIFIGNDDNRDNFMYFSGNTAWLGWDKTSDEFEFTNMKVNGDFTGQGSGHLGRSNTANFQLMSTGLNVAINGDLSRLHEPFEILDDLSITGDLTIGRNLTVHSSQQSSFTGSDATLVIQDGNMRIFSSSESVANSAGFQDDGDVFVEDDLGVGDYASVGGNLEALFSVDIGTEARTGVVNIRSAGFNVDNAGGMYDDDSALILNDSLSVRGDLSVNNTLVVDGSGLNQFVHGHVQIGPGTHTGIADDDGDLYVSGDVDIGGDISIGGNTTLQGVIFGDDFTSITGSLTVTEDLDIRGDLFSGLTDTLGIRDNLSISGDLTISSADFALSDSGNIYFANTSESLYLREETTSEFNFTDDLSLEGALSVGGEEIYFPNTLLADNLSTGFSAISSQADTLALSDASADMSFSIYNNDATQFLQFGMSEDPAAYFLASNELRLKASGDNNDYFYLTTSSNVATLATSAGSTLAIDSGADSIVIVAGDTVNVDADTLVIDANNDRVGVLTATPTEELGVIGDTRLSNILTIGTSELVLNESDAAATLYFANRTQSLAWDETSGEFDMVGSLSITGDLTVSQTFRVGAATGNGNFNILDNDEVQASSLMNGTNDLFADGDIELRQSLSIGNQLTTTGSFRVGNQGAHYPFNVISTASSITASSMMDSVNDLFVGGDIEVGGNVSTSGDITIVGVIFSDNGTTVIGDLTVTDTVFVDHLNDYSNLGIDFNTGTTFTELTTADGDIFATNSILFNPDQDANSFLTLGATSEGDSIILNGYLTFNGGFWQQGGDTTISGAIFGVAGTLGTVLDSFTIDKDGDAEAPTLFFKDADGDEFIRWDPTTDTFHLSDDLSVADSLTAYGDLIVLGGPDNTSFFNGSNTSVHVTDGKLNIASSSENFSASTGFQDAGDVFVEDDVEIGGSLSVGGDPTISGVIFSDDYIEINGPLSVTGDLDLRRDWYDGIGNTIEILDNLSVTGVINSDGTGINRLDAELSMAGHLTLGGDVVLLGSADILGSLSVSGDTSISGVIFGNDYTQIDGPLTVTNDLDLRRNLFNGGGPTVHVREDVDLTGALSATNFVQVGTDGTGTISVGGIAIEAYNAFANAGASADFSELDADNDLLVQGSVEIDGQLDDDGTGLNDWEGRLELGSITTEGGSNPGDLAIGGDLTVVGNNIDSVNALLLNAGKAATQPVFIGTPTHTGIADEDGDLFVLHDMEIGANLSVASDTTIAGVIFGDDFTQFEGNVTVDGDLDVRGRILDGAGVDIDISDNLSVFNDLTVWNNLMVRGTGLEQIRNGRLLVGNNAKSPSIAADAADLYAAGDMEIHGDLSVGGDTTIAGVVFSDDATEILAELTVTGHVYPSSDDAFDLGSPSAEWRNLYIDGTANIDSLIADTADINAGTIDNTLIGDTTPALGIFPNLTVNDNLTLANVNTDNINVRAEFTSDLVPNADSSVDLGSGTQQWQNLYLSTSAEVNFGGDETFEYDGTQFSASDDISMTGVFTVEGTEESYLAGSLAIASSGARSPGDLALSGDLTVEDSARIGSDGTGTIAVGGAPVQAYNAFADSVATKGNASVSSDNDVYMEGSVEIDEQLDNDGTGLNDWEGYLELGNINTEGGTSPGDMAISNDLTIVGNRIDSTSSALALNAGQASAQPVFIGTSSHTGIADEGGDLYILNDFEIGGDLSIAHETTIGGVTFANGDMTVSNSLDVRQNIWDGAGDTVDIRDNLSLSGNLNVDGTGENVFDGKLTVSGDVTLSNTLSVAGDVAIGGNISVGGDLSIAGLLFSQGSLLVSTNLTAAYNLDVRKSIFDGIGTRVDIQDNVSVSGVLNIDGTGTNQFDGDLNIDNNVSVETDLYVTNDIQIGGSLSIAGDTTIAGVIFSDDATQVQGDLTNTGDVDIRGNLFDGAEAILDIRDDVSVTGNVTLTNQLRVGADGSGTFTIGGADLRPYNVIADSTATAGNSSLDGDNDLYIQGTVELDELLDVDGTGLNDWEGRLELGSITTEGGSNPGDLAIGADLTVVGDHIDSNIVPLVLNAGKGANQPVLIGTNNVTGSIANGAGDLFIRNDLEVGRDVSQAGDLTIREAIFSDDFILIDNALTVMGDLDVRQNVLDGAEDILDVRDDLSITGSLSLTDYLQIGRAGTGTFAVGGASVQSYNVLGDAVTGKGNAAIGSDNDLYIEGTLEVDEQMDIDGTGLNDLEGRLELGNITTEGGTNPGDLALEGSLTIVGGSFDSPSQALVLNADKGVNQPVAIGANYDRATIASGAGDLYVTGDVEINGELSLAGDATLGNILFGNDGAIISTTLSLAENIDVRGNLFDGASPYLDIQDDVSITGSLSLTDYVRVGYDGTGTIAVGGANWQAYNAIADATTTQGNSSVTSDNDFYLEGTVEIDEQIDIDGTGLNDLEGRLELGNISSEGGAGIGDVAIGADLTIVGGSLDSDAAGALVLNAGKAANQPVFLGSTSHTGIADENGDLFIFGDMEIGNQASLSGDLTIGAASNFSNLTIGQNIDIRGNIFNSLLPEVNIADSLSITSDLTVDGSVLYIDSLNNRVGINTLTPSATLDISGDGVVSLDVTVGDSLSVANVISATRIPVTIESTFILDYSDISATPTLQFEDATEDETLLWNDGATLQTFELSDDLSLHGQITLSGNALHFGNGARIDNEISDTLRITSPYTQMSNDVTVSGDLTIHGSGRLNIPNGRFVVGDGSLASYASTSGTLYVANNLTSTGVLFGASIAASNFQAEGTVSPLFTIDVDSLPIDQDLSLAFSDDTDDFAHYLVWNDGADTFEFSDDLTITGDLTLTATLEVDGALAHIDNSLAVGDVHQSSSMYASGDGDLFVQGDFELLGDLSVNRNTTIAGVIFDQNYAMIQNNLTVSNDLDVRNRIFDGATDTLDIADNLSVSHAITLGGGIVFGKNSNRIDLGVARSNTTTLFGDVLISGATTIIGDLSVGGVITPMELDYVNVVGDTMTGTLNINVGGEGNLGLDVDGNIEYTGFLKNQSPVKVTDGLNLLNYGGINGGQIAQRDLLLLLEGNLTLEQKPGLRQIFIPTIRFIRYSKASPEIHTKVERVKIVGHDIRLNLTRHEHLLDVTPAASQWLQRNVGLDGELRQPGDYKIAGHNQISLFDQEFPKDAEVTLTYSYRVDTENRSMVTHKIEGALRTLEPGWQVIYVTEKPKSLISAHDTAAMSKDTELVLGISSFEDYHFSADTYVVAIVSDTGAITQYY